MRYRVEQLAAATGVSVDTIRYYQSLGLLDPPEREGRVAWYDAGHAERIGQVRDLQTKGLTLAAINRVLRGELGAADADLAAAVAGARGADELLTIEELSARSGVPATLIEAVEREGIPVGRRVDGEVRFSVADVELVRRALRLLELGLPLGELLALGRDANAALERIAERAVELFDEHVRKPIRDSSPSEDEAAGQMVEAFRELLPAVTELVARHFRSLLLAQAQAHIEQVGDEAEVEATRAESRRLGSA